MKAVGTYNFGVNLEADFQGFGFGNASPLGIAKAIAGKLIVNEICPSTIRVTFSGGESYSKPTINLDVGGQGSGPYPYPWIWMVDRGSYVGGHEYVLSNNGSGEEIWSVEIPHAILKINQSLIPSGIENEVQHNYSIVDDSPVYRTVTIIVQKYEGIYYLTMSPGSGSIDDILVSCQSNTLYGSYPVTQTGPTNYSGTYIPPGLEYSGSDSISLTNFVISKIEEQ